MSAKREKLEATGEIPQLDKRTGVDGKARSQPAPKSTVPLDDPARPRNRVEPTINGEAIAKKVREAVDKKVREAVDKNLADATDALRQELEQAKNEIAVLRKAQDDQQSWQEMYLKARRETHQLRQTVRNLTCPNCGAPMPTAKPKKDGPLLDADWFNKFSKFTNMMGSSNETERHSASDHALKMLNEAKLRWSDVL